MQHVDIYGWGKYQNFAKEIENFRNGGESHILQEFPDGWKFGALFSVWDSEGWPTTADDRGAILPFLPRGEGKRYNNPPPKSQRGFPILLP